MNDPGLNGKSRREAPTLELPSDSVNEAIVLTSALVDHDTRDRLLSTLQVDDFLLEENRAAWQALLDLRRQGLTYDNATLERLIDKKRVQPEYLRELVKLRPLVAPNLNQHIEWLIWDRIRARGAVGPLSSLLEAIQDPRTDQARVKALARHVASAFDAPNESRAKEFSAAERAKNLGSTCHRISTSLAELDVHTRGGLRAPGMTVIGGAPGACKTTFVCQMATTAALSGVPTALIAADEDVDMLLVRVGQQMDFDRDVLERGEEPTRSEFAERLEKTPLLVAVGSDDVDAVVARLVRLAAGRHALLVVDSLQTVTVPGAEGTKDVRARIDHTVRFFRGVATRNAIAVVLTSELARGAYRSNKDRIALISAFKESGAIEYGVDFAAVMLSPDGRDDLVEMNVVKNRDGKRPVVALSFDRTRAALSVTDAGDGTNTIDDFVVERAAAERLTFQVQKILTMLAKRPARSKTGLVSGVRGTKQQLLAAAEHLIATGRIRKDKQGNYAEAKE